jgi:hypothetical protein
VLPFLRRPEAAGWIVLAGSMPSLGRDCPRFPDYILENTDLSWAPCCLRAGSSGDEGLTSFLDDLEMLLNVDVQRLTVGEVPDEVLQTKLSAGGFLMLVGGSADVWVEALESAGLRTQPESALGKGRLLLVIGAAAAALGRWIQVRGQETLVDGLGWIQDAIVLPAVESPAHEREIQEWLKRSNKSYAIGLPPGSVFALGPEGAVEVWGEVSPVVSLGAGWTQA